MFINVTEDLELIDFQLNYTLHPVISPGVVCAVQGTVVFFGIFGYTLFLATLMKNKKHFFKNSFWTFTLHVFVVDSFVLLTAVVYEIPCVYSQKQIYGYKTGQLISRFNSLLYFAIMIMMLTMSVERFVKVVVQGNLARKINSIVFVHVSACCSWILGICVVLLTYYFQCQKIYVQTIYRYYIRCKDGFFILGFAATFCIGLMLLLYSAILIYIRCKTIEAADASRKRKKLLERRLAVQFFFCCVFLTITVIVLSLIEPWQLSSEISGFFASTCFILNSATTPFVYLFSAELRLRLFRLIISCSVKTPPVMDTTNEDHHRS